jgi:hypothetical protein
MKAGEPTAHMYLAPALARRALNVEEKRGEERMAWRKALSLFLWSGAGNGCLGAAGAATVLEANGRSTTTRCHSYSLYELKIVLQ